MPGVRRFVVPRNWWSLPVCTVLLVPATFGCGGDRRSEAGSVDTTATRTPDTTSARAGDTVPVTIPESTPPARRDTAATPGGAARTDSVPKKTARAPRPAPRKPAAQPAADTTAAASPQAVDTPETAATTPSEANAPLRDPYHQPPRDTVSQAVYNGWKQFNLNCARCHGEDVQGTTIAPHLIVSLKPDGPINTKELFVQTVCAGRPAKGMPSWCALGMDMEKINQIYEYVHGRSEGKIHPGRPAVRSG